MKILIVDDESDICELIGFIVQDIFPSDTDTLLAYSGNEAIKILKENDDIEICICDHNMADGMGPDVLKYLIEVKSKTKFVLCSTVIPSDKPNDYPAGFVYTNIQKPEIGIGIEHLFHLVEKSMLEKLKCMSDEFFPVKVHVLSLMEALPADIYIRMSDNKFIKCINQSEEFSSADKEKYTQKFVAELYMKKGEHSPSVNEIILDTVQKIMERRNLPLTEKLNIAHSQLVVLIKFTGITPELAESSKKNIQQSVALIMKNPLAADFWKEMNFLGEYPSTLYTLHSLLASIVVKKLHWSSEATMYKLSLSAFLQDISLDSIPLMEICDNQEFIEKQSRFTPAEVKKYLEHPQRAIEVLASFKEIPPDVDRLLLEQHEMPDGTGFPRKLNANQLGPLTCVFIITGIFARHILKDKSSFDVGAFAILLEGKGYSRGNFKESFEVIKSMRKI
ncbi:MAG: response regulator [Bacteriovorax sp.]|nr:response regulator [Bacteriovorax sp.]